MGLLNVDGFYNSLLSFIDKAVDEGFISTTARQIIVSAPTAKQLVRQLEVFCFIYIIQKNMIIVIKIKNWTDMIHVDH